MHELLCNDYITCKRCKLINQLRQYSIELSNTEEKNIWRFAHARFIEDDIVHRAINTFKIRKFKFAVLLEELQAASLLCCKAITNMLAEQDERNVEKRRGYAIHAPKEGEKALVYYTQPSTVDNVVAIISKRKATYTQGQWIDEHGNVVHNVNSWLRDHE